ncbi:MAG TPA: MarR family transcriptional regulator [Armatimonadota bacterium]|jgi:DNA-binding IscR family transcriptional regulator|nr:MarR family transcriptional regulator [Armatimonadota bacterium]
MQDQEKVLQAFQDASEPLNAGKVAEITGLDRKIVDKIMAQLKADGTIESPKRCFWALKK